MKVPAYYWDTYFERSKPERVVFFPGATWACLFWKTGYSLPPGEDSRLMSMLWLQDAIRAGVIVGCGILAVLLPFGGAGTVALMVGLALGMEGVFFAITRGVVARYPEAAERRGGRAFMRTVARRQEDMPTWRNLVVAFAAIVLTVLAVVGGIGSVVKQGDAKGAYGAIFGGLMFAALAAAMISVLRGQGLRRRNAELERIVAERTAELERVNRHKSEFLANMSHELRTPLNAIIGFSDVMLSGMTGPLPGKQREFVGDIRDSGKHLLALINDILDLSKIEAGRMELVVAPFDVPVAVAEAVALVRERAERHGVKLESLLEPGVASCHGDQRKVKQILLNLLTNAVKFTPAGGTVALRGRRVEGDYEFSVADTGVGIAPEDQPLIFEEFRQVGNDLDRRAEGTGLGLALTRRLVLLHRGRIGLESAPGKGSTFTFTLPIGNP
jgi:signal transduction histidine kinase